MAKEHRFSELGALEADLASAWQDRLTDAQALLHANRNAAAIASGLYAVEILLKALVCKTLDLQQLPSAFEFHDLRGLATVAGLRREIDDPLFKASQVGVNWSDILNESLTLNNLRYQPDANWTSQKASLFFQRLQDPQDGVLGWIRSHF
jgi:hypothetical protein